MDPESEDIYIDREAEYEAMWPALTSAGHAVYRIAAGEAPEEGARIICRDDELTLEVGDWAVMLPNGHTEGAAYYAAGWLHGYADCAD